MVYQKLQAFSLLEFGQRKTGDLMNRVTGDTNRVQHFFQHHVAMAVTEGLTFLGITVHPLRLQLAAGRLGADPRAYGHGDRAARCA